MVAIQAAIPAIGTPSVAQFDVCSLYGRLPRVYSPPKPTPAKQRGPKPSPNIPSSMKGKIRAHGFLVRYPGRVTPIRPYHGADSTAENVAHYGGPDYRSQGY